MSGEDNVAVENFPHSEDLFPESEEVQMETDVSLNESNNQANESLSSDKSNKDEAKILRLPLSRVKHIMKLDPDCSIVSADAAVLVCKATELFLAHLGSVMAKCTQNNKRKVILKRDFDTVIDSEARMCFLDGALE